MSSAIFTTNPLPLRGVLTLMGAQSKSEELMGTSQIELVTSASRRSRTIDRRLAPRLGGLTR